MSIPIMSSHKSSQAARQPLLSVNHVYVRYPNTKENAITDISFTLEQGTIAMVVGPNGSGKSTLIKAVLDIVTYSGSIKLNLPPDTTEERTPFGYVPQRLEFDLDLPITVDEFLALTLTACSHDSQEKDHFITDALRRVSALQLRHRQIGSLSGGQRQRVILARALIHHPHILVLDEPESGIDREGEQQFYTMLKTLVKEQKMAALIATHELEVVHKYADQVLCIQQKLLCSGVPSTALTTKTLTELYGVNKAQYTHDHTH